MKDNNGKDVDSISDIFFISDPLCFYVYLRFQFYYQQA